MRSYPLSSPSPSTPDKLEPRRGRTNAAPKQTRQREHTHIFPISGPPALPLKRHKKFCIDNETGFQTNSVLEMKSDWDVKESVPGTIRSLCHPEINLVQLSTTNGGNEALY